MKFKSKSNNVHGAINSKVILAYAKDHKVYQDALKFATEAYKSQKRDFTGIVYSSHAVTIGCLLLELCSLSEAEMAASALEDVLSRKVMTVGALQERFGAEVASMVQALTPARTDGLLDDYKAYGEALQSAGVGVQSVKLASLLDHLCAVPPGKLRSMGTRITEAQNLLPYLKGGDAELQRRVQMILARLTS